MGGQKVACPGSGSNNQTQTGDKLDVLPAMASLDLRSDPVFTTIVVAIILGAIGLAIGKVKVFGLTLAEYIKPIWYFILVAILTVLWQYLFGLKLDDNLLALRISQWVWELMILASVYKLSQLPDFSYYNMVFLGIFYSLIIHGLKVSIRYYFYNKTLLYCLDRFIYGSLLVMAITVIGFVFVYIRTKKAET